MSGALRRSAQAAAGALLRREGAPSGAQLQARRWVGDLPVKSNKHIETWATYRENVEETFRFDARTLARLSVWAVAVPVLLYAYTVEEYRTTDKMAGRQKRDFM